ncbi:hypothetical protein VTJ83DRAFT_4873 [Remersonia thermophila]|uniref:Uncharacterized protein n=1 Tax=Remersonia thermophila TaxID=72144 RepID=A0ABR4DB73_9PEZI
MAVTMGLFSFLIKNRIKDKETPRAPPYVPRLSPKVRVRGGPTLASRPPDHDPDADQESLHEEPEVASSQLSLPTVSEEEEVEEGEDQTPAPAPDPAPAPAPAPAPCIPRVPAEEVAATSPADPRPVPKRSSSSSGFRIARSMSVASASRSRPESRASVVSSSNTAATATSTQRCSPGLSQVSSLRIDGKPSFKDILDAQSEIRPANFRARVRASGARDYGEDVAERNLGENSFDLGSEHVRAFYQARSGLAPRSHLRAVGEEDVDTEEGKVATNRSSAAASPSARRRSLHSLQETRLSSRSPRYVRGRSMRSQSIGSFASPVLGPERSTSPVPASDLAGQNLHRVLAADLARFDFGFPSTKTPIALPEVPEAAPSPAIPTSRTIRASRSTEGDVAEDMSGVDLDAEDAWGTARARYHHHHPARPSSALAVRKHHGIGTIRSSSVPPPDVGSPTSPRRPRIAVQADRLSHEDAYHAPRHPRFPTIATRRAASRNATTPDSHTADDATSSCDFPPPIRTRVSRGWSASSGSPTAATITSSATTSTVATNASSSIISIVSSSSHKNGNRPASLHTANTSIDLSVHGGVKDLAADGHALAAPAEGQGLDHDGDGKEHINRDDDADSFNIDDYLSTDAESLSGVSRATGTYARPRRPTAVGEEELLLNDAWLVGGDDGGDEAGCDAGDGCCSKRSVATRRGIQLPGLVDVLPLPSPSTSPASIGPGAGFISESQAGGRRVLSMMGVQEVDAEVGPGCCCGHHRHHHHHHRCRDHHGEKELVVHTATRATSPAAYEPEAALAAEDAGYEADYAEDNDAHLDAHYSADDHAGDKDRIATAIQLRKRIKQARRLAGQPTPAVARRRTKGGSLNGPRASPAPTVHVDDTA